MSHYRLALIGFGNVGVALAELLNEKGTELNSKYGITFSVSGIASASHGIAINPNGLDLDQVIAEFKVKPPTTEPDLNKFSVIKKFNDTFEFIRSCGADVLFENSPVNYETGQPALDHCRLGLELGMHVVTANKGPVVHGYQLLRDLADRMGVKFGFESTVMDGAPIFSLFRETLPGANLLSFRGILNSTTNMILTRMEIGQDFDSAVAYAQEIGIAETDPSGDIDGWDAAVKVAALVTVLMDVPMKPHQVDRTGIRGITQENISDAHNQGRRWKLVCSAKREGEKIQARVTPEMVGPESPLYQVNGTTSTVQFETDILGLLTIIEEDPGPKTTAYGCLADFINAVRN